MEPDRVVVFDTTLRDGEQSPGATMTPEEKLEIAFTLARLGVDVIEAGFPAGSEGDWLAVSTIAERVGNAVTPGRKRDTPPTICGLARATERDIDRAWTAVKAAARPRIHTFLATSDVHLEHKLRLTRPQVLERVRTMVGHARALCDDVEFSPEDASRSDPSFLHEVLEVALDAGATTLNIPDTVGFTTPDEMFALISGIREKVPRIERAIVSVHCHDDLGMATANTLAALRAGARQAEVTINGIGERAGNCALEEVVMALATRAAHFGLRTGIDTTQLAAASRLLTSITGIAVPPNKAVVGANAFAHESGIHQDGMLKHHGTYEIMRPEAVGVANTRLVLGKHSGRHALKKRLDELGHVLDAHALDDVMTRFKALADKGKEVTDADLNALAGTIAREPAPLFELEGLQVACGTASLPTATVRLRAADGTMHVHAAVGTGPVHAVYRAIEEVVRAPSTLLEFSVHAVTAGIDALGEVSVRIRSERTPDADNPQLEQPRPAVHYGHGADTDILVASARAYLAAINRMLAPRSAQ
jgi:2-isopropylmalate synthase